MPVDVTQDEVEARSPVGRIVVLVIAGFLVAMWGYVLYLAFGPGRQPPADRLDDPAFAEAGEERCAAALAAVEDLPVASESDSADQRADVLDRSNQTFTLMLDDLEGMLDLAPAGGQRERAGEWIADWQVMLGDREDYATALRDDPDARLLISEKDDTGRHITGWIDEFANANKMPSCVTPGDV